MGRKRRSRFGFTLIEILVVIAILGIIGSVAVVKYMAYLKQAAVDTAEMKLREIGKTLEIYHAQKLTYPETIEELVTPELEGDPSVLKRGALLDPWKNPVQYAPNPGGEPPFMLTSFGPDGMEGTEDDIDFNLLEEDAEGEPIR
jgi:general secretion pathway protein G